MINRYIDKDIGKVKEALKRDQ